MQIRTPAVAGMFYPNQTQELKKLVRDCFLHPLGPGKLPPTEDKKKIYGVICPHAGYVYSGPIASHSFYAISSKPVDLFIIVGPNHWGIGCNVASMKDSGWDTPLGTVQVDSESVNNLLKISEILEVDFFSHTKEHSLEVQIPFLQEFFSNEFKILPIALIDQTKTTAIELGKSIAKIAKINNSMIIGSSDFTHYEPNDFAYKQDTALIEPILELNIDRFYEVLKE
ncbi:MAG: AmmeMemoRadiSam system protein B, partial [Nitrosopumilaceae archaeon]|nr:AmmeMemoRadiSam system protein B [Nitrosopumilaceae archaeon]